MITAKDIAVTSKSKELAVTNKAVGYSEAEREIIMNTVAKLYLEGFSYRAMALWIKENK